MSMTTRLEDVRDSLFTSAAIHEAGHAVIGEKLGLRVTSIRVSVDGTRRGEMGRVEFDPACYDESDESVAIMAAAGPEAEARAERSIIEHNRRHPDDRVYYRAQLPNLDAADLAVVNTYLDRHYYSSPSDRRAMRSQFSRRAADLLTDHWDAVKAVARRLVEVSEVDADGRDCAELDRTAFLAAMRKGSKS